MRTPLTVARARRPMTINRRAQCSRYDATLMRTRSSRESAEVSANSLLPLNVGPLRDAALNEPSVYRDANVRSAKPCVAAPESGAHDACADRATSHNAALCVRSVEDSLTRCPFRRTPAWPPLENVRLRLSPHIFEFRPPFGLQQKVFCSLGAALGASDMVGDVDERRNPTRPEERPPVGRP